MTNYTPLPSLEGNITPRLLANYFRALVNRFFKILPIWEDGINTLGAYMQSLMSELLGCKSLLQIVDDDALFMSLISILQFLMDTPDCDIKDVKREVFTAIDICNKLSRAYAGDKEV